MKRMPMSLENLKGLLSGWIKDEEGASLVEYVLLVALIAVVCIAAVSLLGKAAREKFADTTATLNQKP
jgi:pilus assembly protein Flp/PilA